MKKTPIWILQYGGKTPLDNFVKKTADNFIIELHGMLEELLTK